jgi:hypothetical protein
MAVMVPYRPPCPPRCACSGIPWRTPLTWERIVELQRPDRVPFDLAAELHLTFDAVAVAHRRAMRAHGFD